MWLRELRSALSMLAAMTLLTGFAYPLALSAIAAVAFPVQATGSLVRRGRSVVGSALIGQSFIDPGHFWSRPSATVPLPYDGLASGGSNLGPLNPALTERIGASVRALRDADPRNSAPVPVDLVTASASGLDPDISVAAARYQAARIARARNLPAAGVEALIDAHRRAPWLGFVGEPRVNVLELNLALDAYR